MLSWSSRAADWASFLKRRSVSSSLDWTLDNTLTATMRSSIVSWRERRLPFRRRRRTLAVVMAEPVPASNTRPISTGGKWANASETAPGGDFEITVCSESKFAGNSVIELATTEPSIGSAAGWDPSAETVTLLAANGDSQEFVESLGAGSPDDGAGKRIWLELPPVIVCGSAAKNVSARHPSPHANRCLTD